MLTSTDDCTHQQDTIIECEGEGDNTGKSQWQNSGTIPPPPLGKLPYIPIQTLECDTNHELKYF